MKKIEMIVRPDTMEMVKEIVEMCGAGGLTVSQVMGAGVQKGKNEKYRGAEMNINLLHKLKVEVVVPDDMVDTIVNKVSEGIRTGDVGDGKIFVSPVDDAIRVRTGENGDKAL
jgi:nitrogen regulatory protein P-II 1